MKKGAAFLLAILLLLLSCPAVLAEEQGLSLHCKAALIMDMDSGQVLYAEHEHEKLAPASITKVMTVLLVMEALDAEALHLEDKVTVSAHASSMAGSQIWLAPGEEMTVDELLRATMISSANDAAVALAEAVSGTEEEFVRRMNEACVQLGLENSHFCNASGLDDDDHYTTAYDIGILCKELLKHELVQKYSTVWMDSLRGGKTELVNTNKLVRYYEGITGLKTGTTSKAGRCLAASARRNHLHVLAVILGCGNNKDRYGGAESMLNWAFANFESVVPKDASSGMTPIPVLHGKSQTVKVFSQIEKPMTLKKGTARELEYRVTVADNLAAPVEEYQKVGHVEVLQKGKVLASYPICAAQKVEKMDFAFAFLLYLREILKIS